jgi:uncharacterized protein YegP (UPF0339 family)
MSARVEIYREERLAAGADADGEWTRTVLGKWRWRFISSNGRILADSGQGYRHRTDCLSGCATVLGGQVVEGTIARAVVGESLRTEYVPVVDLTRQP